MTSVNDRYCDEPHCTQPLVPLGPDNELAVHLKSPESDFASTINRIHVDAHVVYIHRRCYRSSLHERA